MACRARGIASIETGPFAGYSRGILNRRTVPLMWVLVTRPSFIASSYPRRPRRGSALQTSTAMSFHWKSRLKDLLVPCMCSPIIAFAAIASASSANLLSLSPRTSQRA